MPRVRVGRGAVLAAVAVLALVACSRLYGIKLRAESSRTLDPSCVDAALSDRENVRSTRHRDDWTGWEFPGPHGRTRVDLLGDDEVHVSWTQLNRAFPAAACIQMRPFLEELYEDVRTSCAGLPPRAHEVDLPCSE